MKRRNQITIAAPTIALLLSGLPLTAQSQAMKAPFDGSKLQASSHSYSVLIQGNAAGTMETSTSVDNGTVTGHVEMEISFQGATQTIVQDVTFRANDLRMISSSQVTDVSIMHAETSVQYDNGHVTGRGQTPTPTGEVATVEIDTVLGSDVIDSGAAFILLGTLEWTDGAIYSFDAFQSSAGTVSSGSATAVASEQVTVPEGEFDTWKITTGGLAQPFTLWLDKTDGSVVKMGVNAGISIEFVRGRQSASPTD